MNRYVVEFLGTFFLVFTIGNVVIEPGAGNMAPLAIGAVLMVMIYAGGHISGAHYNPAITLAVYLRGKCSAKDVGPYMGSQIAAAVLAAMLVNILKGPDVETVPSDLSGIVVQALLAEFLFTFALAFVILNVATAASTAGNSYYGLAIGFTVLAGAYAVGGISGGVFNPAVAIGVTLMDLSGWSQIWIYFVANFAGAAAATYTFQFVNGPDA